MNPKKLLAVLVTAALVGIPAWTLKEVIELKVAVGRIDARFCDHLSKSHVYYESDNCNTLAQRP